MSETTTTSATGTSTAEAEEATTTTTATASATGIAAAATTIPSPSLAMMETSATDANQASSSSSSSSATTIPSPSLAMMETSATDANQASSSSSSSSATTTTQAETKEMSEEEFSMPQTVKASTILPPLKERKTRRGVQFFSQGQPLPAYNELSAPPSDTTTQLTMLKAAHNATAHLGVTGMLLWLSNMYGPNGEWKERKEQAVKVASECTACILLKPHRANFVTAASRLPLFPLHRVAMDVLGPLTPSAEGYTYVLVLVDVFTRYVWLRPLMSQTQHVVCQVIEAIFTEYGVPFELVTDPASIFKGHEFRQLLQTYGVDHHLSTPPSHAGTGVVERYIGLTRTALAIQNLQNKRNWSQNLLAAQTMLNNRVSETTGMTPYQLFFHRTYFYPSPPLVEDTSAATDDDLSELDATNARSLPTISDKELMEELRAVWGELGDHLAKDINREVVSQLAQARKRQNAKLDKSRSITKPLPVDTWVVLLYDHKIDKKGNIPYQGMFFKVKSVVQGLHFLVDRHGHPYSHGVRRDRIREVPQEVVFKQIEVEQVHAVEDDGPITFYVVDYRNDDGELERVRVAEIEVANRSFLLEQANKVKVHKTRTYVAEAQRQADEAQQRAVIADHQATIATARAHASIPMDRARPLPQDDGIRLGSLVRLAHHSQQRSKPRMKTSRTPLQK